MKYLICSDIHGSETACKKVVDFFNKNECEKLLILGDILYHGPRNPLPEGHNPKGVIELLNPLANKIIACRGNCDAEVDQMVLKFSVLADFFQLFYNNISIFGTHGHVYAPLLADGNIPTGCETAGKRPLVNTPGIVFYGHTHVSILEKNGEGTIVCNPGSVSLPKGGTEAGFALLELGSEKNTLSLCSMDGNILKTISL
ncbi:MAG: phosphodiesterase [Treponema sp.]|nr:phosphodiesterase [Treponema sp.]